MKTVALILFIITYVLMILLSDKRPFVALASAVLYVILGIMPAKNVFSAIDWNVLMMLAGTMGTVALFIESKMPNRLADLILKKTPNVMWVAVAMSLFAGVVSAFVDNVATVLMIAPVGLAICKKLKISPVPMLLCIAVSSNLQGAATLVGDTTSIMLGGYAKMDFLDFIFMNGKPSIFWAVELGALATVPVIMLLFRKEKGKVELHEVTRVENYFPTFLLVATVALLITASFVPNTPALINGYICLGLFAVGLVHSTVRNKGFSSATAALREIDFKTLLLLGSLFVVIGSLTEAGVIDEISALFVRIGGNNLFLMYSLIVWGSVILSAFIDNIPYVATMLPVVTGIASMMGCSPYVLYFGLLCGATLGGNLTPIGASANIAAIGILQKEGCEVKSKDFFRIGIPFTLTAVVVGYLFTWFVWA
ncbi:MAG: SLC13 family permease [Clostridia bacterium]|nr:SLC13 family permease [Clostridia bacterium]MDY2929377.1 SLC13 family permease [Clostridiaceae bacterium]